LLPLPVSLLSCQLSPSLSVAVETTVHSTQCVAAAAISKRLSQWTVQSNHQRHSDVNSSMDGMHDAASFMDEHKFKNIGGCGCDRGDKMKDAYRMQT